MEKKLTKKTLHKVMMRWYHGATTCGSYAMMCMLGYACAMFPALKELYPDVEERKQAIKTYGVYYNTELFLGASILGMNCALEEAKASGQDVDGDMINNIRTSLMGPIAGIGDSLLIGTYLPILLAIAVSLSSGGSIFGPLFYIVVWNLSLYGIVRFVFNKGYHMGKEGVGFIIGEKAEKLKNAISKVGLIVTGAVAATWAGVSTQLNIVDGAGNTVLNLQSTLDSIYPGLITFGLVYLNWWLMAKKKFTPIKCILLMFLLAFIGVCRLFQSRSVLCVKEKKWDVCYIRLNQY